MFTYKNYNNRRSQSFFPTLIHVSAFFVEIKKREEARWSYSDRSYGTPFMTLKQVYNNSKLIFKAPSIREMVENKN